MADTDELLTYIGCPLEDPYCNDNFYIGIPDSTVTIAREVNNCIERQCQQYLDITDALSRLLDGPFKSNFPNLNRLIDQVEYYITSIYPQGCGLRKRIGEGKIHHAITGHQTDEEIMKWDVGNGGELEKFVNKQDKSCAFLDRCYDATTSTACLKESVYCPKDTSLTQDTGCSNNSVLKPNASDNCQSRLQKDHIFRLMPWIKHENKYTLVCMACGLPLNITNNKLFQVNSPILDFETMLSDTECDHIIPFITMWAGLNKNTSIFVADPQYSSIKSIGIGSNFVPLHKFCNLHKSAGLATYFWNITSKEENIGEILPDYTDDQKAKSGTEWIKKFWYKAGARSAGNAFISAHIASGSSQFIQGDAWLKTHKWNPKLISRQLQSRYYSALEFLVRLPPLVHQQIFTKIFPILDNFHRAEGRGRLDKFVPCDPLITYTDLINLSRNSELRNKSLEEIRQIAEQLQAAAKAASKGLQKPTEEVATAFDVSSTGAEVATTLSEMVRHNTMAPPLVQRHNSEEFLQTLEKLPRIEAARMIRQQWEQLSQRNAELDRLTQQVSIAASTLPDQQARSIEGTIKNAARFRAEEDQRRVAKEIMEVHSLKAIKKAEEEEKERLDIAKQLLDQERKIEREQQTQEKILAKLSALKDKKSTLYEIQDLITRAMSANIDEKNEALVWALQRYEELRQQQPQPSRETRSRKRDIDAGIIKLKSKKLKLKLKKLKPKSKKLKPKSKKLKPKSKKLKPKSKKLKPKSKKLKPKSK